MAIFKNFGLNLNLNDIKLISLSKNMDFPDTNDWSSITDYLIDMKYQIKFPIVGLAVCPTFTGDCNQYPAESTRTYER